MTVSDATLRNLAGEHDRIERSKHLTADRPVMAAIAQTSEMAAELLRHRASERADRERVRQVVRDALDEADRQQLPDLDAIADRAAEQLAAAVVECQLAITAIHAPSDVTDAALLAEAAPPVAAPLIDDVDREQIDRWCGAYSEHRPSVAAALRKLLGSAELTSDERDELVAFASHSHVHWPITCAAVARVLDGMP